MAKKSGKKKNKNKIPNAVYEAELFRLQAELVKVQLWAQATGARVVVVFEGRDAAGKGGTIKRITEYLSPRVVRIAALPTPTEREKAQWYYQRYVDQLPSGGRDRPVRPLLVQPRRRREGHGLLHAAGVQPVHAPDADLRADAHRGRDPAAQVLVLRLRQEQLKRFRSRLNDPVRQWKLSPMDTASLSRWEDYSKAKDEMLVHTDVPASPWFIVESDIKKHARLNMISHLLSTIPYTEVPHEKVVLPDRPAASNGYERPPRELSTYVPDHVAALMGDPEKHL